MVANFLNVTDLSLQTRRTMEEKYGLPFFLSAIMYGKVIHVNFFVSLFLSYRAGPRLLEIQNFLLPWQRDVTTFPLCPDPVSAVNETRLTAGSGARIIHTSKTVILHRNRGE